MAPDRVAIQSLTVDLVESPRAPSGLVIMAITGRIGEPVCDF